MTLKKLVLKTAVITFGVSLILLLSTFGVLSLYTPYFMADLTASIGLESMSGDYCFQEYERSGKIEALARSFEIAASKGADRKASDRFLLLYENEGFSDYCQKVDEGISHDGNLPSYQYRFYVCGLNARVQYRLSKTDEEKLAVCEFAVKETDKSFSVGNPVMYLATESAKRKDADFSALLRGEMEKAEFEQNEFYRDTIKLLEGRNE